MHDFKTKARVAEQRFPVTVLDTDANQPHWLELRQSASALGQR